ncbi:MAG: helix-turn-helix transcriptional regulator, partial [Vicinamibacterales bacterium]
FRGLATGLTVSELCALYFSRTLLETLAGTPFSADLASAFDKLAGVLTPHMQRFLDQLPHVIAAKGTRVQPPEEGHRPLVGRLLEAILHQRQTRLTYHSTSSGRTKMYLVHPLRLAYAQGALYLLAFVPEYAEVRTFATDRVQDVSLLEERFERLDEAPDEAFPHSLGVHSGEPERVRVRFDAGSAPYVRSRAWHPSQLVEDLPDGGVDVTLHVCVDRALRSWILGFGAAARALEPAALADDIERELGQARARYTGSRAGQDA